MSFIIINIPFASLKAQNTIKHHLVAGSFMQPLAIRQLRDFMRYRFKHTNFMSRKKNRLQNSLTVTNIQLGNVVSNTVGKSSMNIINQLLENPLVHSFDVQSLFHGSMKDKHPELVLTIDGLNTPEQAGKLRVIRQHYDALQNRKSDLEGIILCLCAPYAEEINLILTVPSFKNIFSAITVISKIGVNMVVFPSAKHLCSWAGLTPTNNESAGNKKSVKISRAGCYIKPQIRNHYLKIKKTSWP